MSLANPVDLTASGDESDFGRVLATACADKNVDIIMLYIVLHLHRMTENMMDIIAKYAAIKPVLFCAAGTEHTQHLKNYLENKGVPAYTTVEEWVSAAEALTF